MVETNRSNRQSKRPSIALSRMCVHRFNYQSDYIKKWAAEELQKGCDHSAIHSTDKIGPLVIPND